jgi:hypothetical protein
MANKTTEEINAELQEEVWEDVPQNDGTWKPQEAGETLIGSYDNYEETRTGKKLYTIVNDEMEPVKVWGGKIVDSFFNHKTGVQIGERVRITFLGKKPINNADGTQRINAETGEPMYYNDYKVQHTKGKRPASQLSEQDKEDLAAIKEVEAAESEDKIDPKKIPF